MDVNKILNELNSNLIKFHTRFEHDLFESVLLNYLNKSYVTSTHSGFVLYESIFTTRLIRESSYPKDLIPSKENIITHMNLIISNEDDITNTYKLKLVIFLNILYIINM